MATGYEKLSSNKVKLTFTVAAEEFDSALVKAYRKNAKNIAIPGFRKGHAPMQVVERHYGSSIFYEDALDLLFPDLYRAAIEEHQINPVDRPELDVQQIGKGQELQFTCEVFVRPDVKLGEYKHTGVVKTVEEVTDDDVKAEIERARDRASRYIEITDRPAKLDDQVNIDYAGFVGEEQFQGGTAEKQDLVLGSGTFIPGFEDQLVGAEIGQELDVNVTFPEEYHAEELKGKAAVFHVKLNAIREKETPALDDDFVKEASEEANTVEEYTAEVRARLEKQADQKAENAFENEVIEKAVEGAEIDIPAAMIDDQVDNMIREMEMRLMYQGMKLDDYLKYTGQTREDLQGMYKTEAERRVRTSLVLHEIRRVENLEPSEEDIDKVLGEYAEQSKQELEQFKNNLTESDKEYFTEVAQMNRIIAFLKDNAAAE